MKDADSDGDEEKPQYGPQMPDPRKEEEGQRKIQSEVGVATVTVTAIGGDSDSEEEGGGGGDESDDELDAMIKEQTLKRKLEKANGGELSKARALGPPLPPPRDRAHPQPGPSPRPPPPQCPRRARWPRCRSGWSPGLWPSSVSRGRRR